MSTTAANAPAGLWFDFNQEQRMLRKTVHDFVEREIPKSVSREAERREEFPRAIVDSLAKAGLYGIGIPEEHGGEGGDLIDQVIVQEELSRSLAGLAWMWGINVWSGGKAIINHGSDAQKAELLPELASGELLFAFAMTEPGGGTDVLRAMTTRATRADGGWVINGNKIWSTLSHIADRVLVLARTSDHEKPSRGLTMFLVDGKAEGFSATPIPKLGMRALGSCQVTLRDVFVSDDDVLGEVDQGWRGVTDSLNSERIMVAAMCTGILAGVLEDAIAYASERRAFGKPIGQMQAIQHKIAEMAMNLETCRLHTYRAAWMEREGRPCGVEATTAKVLASELATAGANEGIQILGGNGYAAEYDMQRYWRDVRLLQIGPITSEMARNYIGESLGLPRSF
ncbi:MAG TPA: acyl-CoA dehydrogenase family protein [Baekduia sp.]|uniref:acyl-CoA dehydrogenase family protein n=1 Tax=Baekduia sp. TaxID=2600305 RepID=UPI002D781FD0|nr:acyl-CoA dehydrogenase family protein [Baekduia sp.]HET6507011.1 acyl-CoA dehydrogenase family protein [Baekduia sp.]